MCIEVNKDDSSYAYLSTYKQRDSLYGGTAWLGGARRRLGMVTFGEAGQGLVINADQAFGYLEEMLRSIAQMLSYDERHLCLCAACCDVLAVSFERAAVLLQCHKEVIVKTMEIWSGMEEL
jgi:hypothetical protein